MAAAATKAPPGFSAIDQLCINTIRTLAMDAVQKAHSGHPGAPMGLAPVAYALWQRYLRYDPQDPTWPGRDRFVLSNGHASMLQYALIHLTGIKNIDQATGKVLDEPSLDLDQIKNFRQLGSRTPGHPEREATAGVETTTGPLGQGAAVSVGMAIAQRWKAAHYGRPGFEGLFDYRVYAILGDGCMMEGITSEAASLAGHLKLPNLTWIYDDNNISIDGSTDLAFTEDVGARFAAYGWNVLRVADGNDLPAFCRAVEAAQKTTDRPTLIVVKTVIGYGSPKKAGTKEAHGEALGDDEVKATKQFYGWPEDAQFLVPDGVYDHFRAGVGQRGAEAHAACRKKFAEYKTAHPDLAAQVERMVDYDLPDGWDKDVPTFPADAKGLATRDSSGKVLNAIAKNVPWVVGGAADLNPSTKTFLTFEGAGTVTATNPGGRNIHFGVREHAMGAVMNGLTLSILRGYGSGFLIFSDYGRGALRLAAVQHAPVLYVFTHDSIGVGEDGPTHQPIEHLASLRAMPNLCLIRPADANEVAEAYRVAMHAKHTPTVLALTRQAVPTFDRSKYAKADGLQKGGYVLADAAGGKPDVLLIGTGSEVQLCVEAYEKLTAEGVKARVVSLPSWNLFESQPKDYRDAVIPPNVTARVCVEMASVFGWERYAGPTGTVIGMTTFGKSAPLKDLLKHFGFTADHVYQAARQQLARS
jgi:transketolase